MRLTNTKDIILDDNEPYRTLVFAISFEITNWSGYNRWSRIDKKVGKWVKKYPQHIFSYAAAFLVHNATGRPLDILFFDIAYTVDGLIESSLPSRLPIDFSRNIKRRDLMPPDGEHITDTPYYSEVLNAMKKYAGKYMVMFSRSQYRLRYTPDERKLRDDVWNFVYKLQYTVKKSEL